MTFYSDLEHLSGFTNKTEVILHTVSLTRTIKTQTGANLTPAIDLCDAYTIPLSHKIEKERKDPLVFHPPLLKAK